MSDTQLTVSQEPSVAPSKSVVVASERHLIDLTGLRHGRIVVVSRAPNRGKRKFWNCVCDCGTAFEMRSDSLNDPRYVSCGCYHREDAARTGRKTATHGEKSNATVSKEYRAWVGMIGRCENPNHPKFSSYGARGIRVSPKWRNSFSNFLKDMGRKPHSSLSLDRENNDGNYEPGNCRWATSKQQANNRRKRITK